MTGRPTRDTRRAHGGRPAPPRKTKKTQCGCCHERKNCLEVAWEKVKIFMCASCRDDAQPFPRG